MRDAGFLCGLSDAACYFVDDHVVVGGVPANEAAEADDGVVFFGFGESSSGRGDLESARDADDFYVIVFHLATEKSVIGASQ